MPSRRSALSWLAVPVASADPIGIDGDARSDTSTTPARRFGDLTSENITLQVIPEPTAALLLGFGLAGLVARRRAS